MAVETLAFTQQLALNDKPVQIFDHPQFRSHMQPIAPISGDGFEPKVGVFSSLVQHQSPIQYHNPNAGYPAPMQEANRMGGKLRIEEARQLSAVLERFQQSQQSRWQEMINRVKSNPGSDVSPLLTKQLEMKMDNINRQFGQLNKTLNLPGAQNQDSSAFIQSLGVTTTELSKPLKTFFNFIARGERQLYGLQAEIDSIYSRDNEMISPALLLKLQLKMTHVSQQIELFTSMLNKGLESSKTVFNTQI